MNNTTNTDDTKPTNEEIADRFQGGVDEFLGIMFSDTPDFVTQEHEERLRSIIKAAMTLGNVLGSIVMIQDKPLTNPIMSLAIMTMGADMVGNSAALIQGKPVPPFGQGSNLIKGTANITVKD